MLWKNKLKCLTVSWRFLEEILKEGEHHVKTINGLPEDIEIRRIEFPEQTYSIPHLYLVIYSESFPELKDGDLIPKIEPPHFEKLNK